MPPLQPRNGAPRLQLLPGLPQTSPNRYDAVLLLIPEKSRPGRGLPDATRWLTLHRRGTTDHGTVRTTTLDNSRQTLAVLGYCRKDADAFEQLRVAGLLAQRALLERPRPRRIAVIVQNAGAERSAWQESLYAALAAHCFQMPSAKHSTDGPPPVPAIDIVGASKLDLRRVVSTAEATNLVRHLTALPPNVLDAPGYRRLLGALSRRHGLKLRWYSEAALEKLGAGAFLAVSRGNARARCRHRAPELPAARRRSAASARTWRWWARESCSIPAARISRRTAPCSTCTPTCPAARWRWRPLWRLAKLKAPLRRRCVAGDFGKLDWPARVSAAGSGPRAQWHDHPGDPQRCRGTHGAGRYAGAGRAQQAAHAAGLRHAHRRVRPCAHRTDERPARRTTTRSPTAALAAGTHSGERLWRFPMPEDFDTDIESQVADVAQCALEGKGDHILAARFLQRFVPKGMPWAHVDLSSSTRRGGLAQVPTRDHRFRRALRAVVAARRKAAAMDRDTLAHPPTRRLAPAPARRRGAGRGAATHRRAVCPRDRHAEPAAAGDHHRAGARVSRPHPCRAARGQHVPAIDDAVPHRPDAAGRDPHCARQRHRPWLQAVSGRRHHEFGFAGVTDIRRIDAVLETMAEARHAAAGARRGDRARTSMSSIARRASSTTCWRRCASDCRDCASCSNTSPRARPCSSCAPRMQNVAATLTPQHLALNRNALFVGGIRPHHYCLPVLKRETRPRARCSTPWSAATGASSSAPTARRTRGRPRKQACGCAGIYSAHAALELYAQIFEEAGALHRLEAFASEFGRAVLRPATQRRTHHLVARDLDCARKLSLRPGCGRAHAGR